MTLLTITNEMLPRLKELYCLPNVREALAYGPQEPSESDVTAILYKAKPGTYTEAWAIAEQGVIQGSISLANISPQHRSAEITNRALFPNAGWMVGYKAVLEVIRYAFDELNLNRVECWVYDSNRATHALCKRLERYGARCEARLTQEVFRHNQYHDLFCYAITKDRWSDVSTKTP